MLNPALAQALAVAHIEDLHRAAARRRRSASRVRDEILRGGVAHPGSGGQQAAICCPNPSNPAVSGVVPMNPRGRKALPMC
jgi:hypothetical protein